MTTSASRETCPICDEPFRNRVQSGAGPDVPTDPPTLRADMTACVVTRGGVGDYRTQYIHKIGGYE